MRKAAREAGRYKTRPRETTRYGTGELLSRCRLAQTGQRSHSTQPVRVDKRTSRATATRENAPDRDSDTLAGLYALAAPDRLLYFGNADARGRAPPTTLVVNDRDS